MGMVLDSIGGRVTNPSTTITAYTANTGDSFTIRNFNPGSPAYMIGSWGLGATAGIQQIRSPRMHDNVRGIRAKLLAADSRPTWHRGAKQMLYPQDTLVFEASGGGAETDSGCMLCFYGDLSGGSAQLITPEAVQARAVNYVTVETTHTTGATLGDWSGAVAINSGSALLKANTDYAILGYLTDTNITSVGYYGPDTSNFRPAGPGTSIRTVTREWFADLSRWTNLPTIPVFNNANAGATFVNVQHNSSGATVVIETLLMQLS